MEVRSGKKMDDRGRSKQYVVRDVPALSGATRVKQPTPMKTVTGQLVEKEEKKKHSEERMEEKKEEFVDGEQYLADMKRRVEESRRAWERKCTEETQPRTQVQRTGVRDSPVRPSSEASLEFKMAATTKMVVTEHRSSRDKMMPTPTPSPRINTELALTSPSPVPRRRTKSPSKPASKSSQQPSLETKPTSRVELMTQCSVKDKAVQTTSDVRSLPVSRVKAPPRSELILATIAQLHRLSRSEFDMAESSELEELSRTEHRNTSAEQDGDPRSGGRNPSPVQRDARIPELTSQKDTPSSKLKEVVRTEQYETFQHEKKYVTRTEVITAPRSELKSVPRFGLQSELSSENMEVPAPKSILKTAPKSELHTSSRTEMHPVTTVYKEVPTPRSEMKPVPTVYKEVPPPRSEMKPVPTVYKEVPTPRSELKPVPTVYKESFSRSEMKPVPKTHKEVPTPRSELKPVPTMHKEVPTPRSEVKITPKQAFDSDQKAAPSQTYKTPVRETTPTPGDEHEGVVLRRRDASTRRSEMEDRKMKVRSLLEEMDEDLERWGKRNQDFIRSSSRQSLGVLPVTPTEQTAVPLLTQPRDLSSRGYMRKSVRVRSRQTMHMMTASLMYLRAINSRQPFFLASNMAAANIFGDIVFRTASTTTFLHLIHRNTDDQVGYQQLLTLSGKADFGLMRCCRSFMKVKEDYEVNDDLNWCGDFDDFDFVVYTSSIVDDDVEMCMDKNVSLLSSNSEGVFHFQDSTLVRQGLEEIVGFKKLLQGLKDRFSVNLEESRKVVKATVEKFKVMSQNVELAAMKSALDLQPSRTKVLSTLRDMELVDELSSCDDFISQLHLYVDQADEQAIDDLILEEIKQALDVGDDSEAVEVLEELYTLMSSWWADEAVCCDWFTEQSGVWQTIVAGRMERVAGKVDKVIKQVVVDTDSFRTDNTTFRIDTLPGKVDIPDRLAMVSGKMDKTDSMHIVFGEIDRPTTDNATFRLDPMSGKVDQSNATKQVVTNKDSFRTDNATSRIDTVSGKVDKPDSINIVFTKVDKPRTDMATSRIDTMANKVDKPDSMNIVFTKEDKPRTDMATSRIDTMANKVDKPDSMNIVFGKIDRPTTDNETFRTDTMSGKKEISNVTKQVVTNKDSFKTDNAISRIDPMANKVDKPDRINIVFGKIDKPKTDNETFRTDTMSSKVDKPDRIAMVSGKVEKPRTDIETVRKVSVSGIVDKSNVTKQVVVDKDSFRTDNASVRIDPMPGKVNKPDSMNIVFGKVDKPKNDNETFRRDTESGKVEKSDRIEEVTVRTDQDTFRRDAMSGKVDKPDEIDEKSVKTGNDTFRIDTVSSKVDKSDSINNEYDSTDEVSEIKVNESDGKDKLVITDILSREVHGVSGKVDKGFGKIDNASKNSEVEKEVIRFEGGSVRKLLVDIQRGKVVNVVVKDETTRVVAAKVLQGLKVEHYVCVGAKELVLKSDEVFQDVSKYLVIVCDEQLSDEEVNVVVRDIEKILTERSSVRCIIVSTKNDNLSQKLQRTILDFAKIYDSCLWNDLTEESKAFLRSRQVFFQGYRMPLNLLFPDSCQLSSVVNGTTLLKLSKEECVIGQELSLSVEYFVPRRLKRNDVIKHVASLTDISDRIVLLSGESDMGKNTLITHLAESVKLLDPTAWVLCINLKDSTSYLATLNPNQIDKNTSIDFLTQCARVNNSLEAALFKERLLSNGKIVAFIECTDETFRLYEDVVCSLLTHLTKTRIDNVWITSSNMSQKWLEEVLGVKAFALQPFSSGEQKLFFTTYWTNDFPSDGLFLNTFVDQVMKHSESISDRENIAPPTPLQSLVLAEYFDEYLRDHAKLPEKVNMFNFIEKYVQKNIEKHCFRKVNQSSTNEAQMFWENHVTAALNLLLHPDEFLALNLQNTDNYSRFCKNMEESQETIGIVKFVGKKPHFILKSCAEYFVAIWMSQNYTSSRDFLRESLFEPRFNVVKNFLDQHLASKIELHDAVVNRDLPTVNRLLSSGVNVNQTDEGGRTALHLAAGGSCPLIAQTLLSNGARVDVVDKLLEWRPLQYADRAQAWTVAKMILPLGGQVEDLVDAKKNIQLEVFNEFVSFLRNSSSSCVELMILASRHGDLPVVQFLVDECGADVSCWGEEDTSPMHEGADMGHIDVLRYLLKHNASVTIADADNNLPLHYAASKGHTKAMKFLLDQGSPVNAFNIEGLTPLLGATWCGDTKPLKFLLTRGADVNAGNLKRVTPLLNAIQHAHIDAAKLLISNGADVNAVSAKGWTPLLRAMDQGDLHLIADLMQHGATMSTTPSTTLTARQRDMYLQLAAYEGDATLVRRLVDDGADVNCCNTRGTTPLHWAVLRGNLHAVRTLIELDANVNAVDNYGVTPVFYVCDMFHEGDDMSSLEYLYDMLEMLKSLLMNGGDVGATAHDGEDVKNYATRRQSPADVYIEDLEEISEDEYDERFKEYSHELLYRAVKDGNVQSLKYFKENGMNINILTRDNDTVLHLSAQWGQIDILKYLIDEGADLEAVNANHDTVLHRACYSGDVDVVKYLVKLRVDVNPVNVYGNTPLHRAAVRGKLEVVKYLAENGADLQVVNKKGQRAVDRAAQSVVDYLTSVSN